MPRTTDALTDSTSPIQTPASGPIGMSDMNAATRVYADLNKNQVAGGFTSSDETTKLGGAWNNKAALSEMWAWYARKMFPIAEGTNIDKYSKSQVHNQGTLGAVGTAHQKWDGGKAAVKFSDFRNYTSLTYYERIKPRAVVGGYYDKKNGSYAARFQGFNQGEVVKLTCDKITKTGAPDQHSSKSPLITFTLGVTVRVHSRSSSWHMRQSKDSSFQFGFFPVVMEFKANDGTTVKATNRALSIGKVNADWYGLCYHQEWNVPQGGVSAGWGKWLQNNGSFPYTNFSKWTGVGNGDMGAGTWSYSVHATDASGNSRDPLPGTYTYVDMVDFGVNQPNTWAIRCGGDDASTFKFPSLGLTFTGAGFPSNMPPDKTFKLPAGANRYQKIECTVTNGNVPGSFQGRNPCALAAAIYNTSKPEQVAAIAGSTNNIAFGENRHKLTWTSRQSGNWHNGITIFTHKGSKVQPTHAYGDPMFTFHGWGNVMSWTNYSTGNAMTFLNSITKIGYDLYTGKYHVGESGAPDKFKHY